MLYLLPCGSQHLKNSLSISVMTSKRQTHSLIDFSDVKSLGATFQVKLNELFALNRSLTGRSNRLTLDSISQWTELQIIETPSGTKAFDWQVPQEWQLNAAYIEDAEGNRLIDIANNPLHVVSYSIECDITLSFSELEDHLHTHPNRIRQFLIAPAITNQHGGFALPTPNYHFSERQHNLFTPLLNQHFTMAT